MNYGFLEEIAQVVQQYSETEESQRTEYNLFQVLGILGKEVLICRVLADLLNPVGTHRRGSLYLREFFCEVLKEYSVEESELENMKVYREYEIDGERRIDIVICSRNRFIPVEVKIYAGEQKSQCYDYYRYAVRQDASARVVYLTRTGKYPGKYSRCKGALELPEEKIYSISFQKHILRWLDKLIAQEKGSMKYSLEQFREAVESFVRAGDMEMKQEIAGKIISDEEHFRSGLAVCRAMDTAKAELIRLVLEEIKEQMKPLQEKYGLTLETEHSWYSYEEQATEDFYHSYSTYPGLNYVVSKAKFREDISMWLRIEVEHRLFAGFCLFNNSVVTEEGIGNQQDEIEEDLKNEAAAYLEERYIKPSAWWLLWRYLPTGSDNGRFQIDTVPDFKAMNEAAVRLSNQEKRKEFAAECVKVIEEELLGMLK